MNIVTPDTDSTKNEKNIYKINSDNDETKIPQVPKAYHVQQFADYVTDIHKILDLIDEAKKYAEQELVLRDYASSIYKRINSLAKYHGLHNILDEFITAVSIAAKHASIRGIKAVQLEGLEKCFNQATKSIRMDNKDLENLVNIMESHNLDWKIDIPISGDTEVE